MNNLNYDYKPLPPFKWFILQNFPFIEADFDALTNWQLFCKLGKEINKIVEDLNMTGEQVENLTNAFNSLKSYVDNYFENLDIQDEINNKLDEMVDDGTLEEIISEYLQINGILSFNSIAELKLAENLINGSFVKTYGFYNANDRGGSFYKVRTKTNDDVTNDVTLVALYDNTLVAELIKENEMNIKQFGLLENGTTDDSAKFQIALDFTKNYKLFLNNATILLDNYVTLDNNTLIGNNTTIKAKAETLNDSYMLKIINNNKIEGIKFDGNNSVKQITTESFTCGKLEVYNCEFTNCKLYTNESEYALNSCFLVDSKELIVKNSSFHDNYCHGLRLYTTQNDATVLIDGCQFYNNGVIDGTKVCIALGLFEAGRSYGLFKNATISNSVAYSNGNSGFALHSTANCTIQNCNSYSNGEHGYCLMDGENGKILNCNSKQNGSYGFRIQGDYSSDNPGYKNFMIKNCISENEANIYVSNHVDTGIIEDNILYCKTNYGFCMTIGENVDGENISNLIITNNKIISNYTTNYPIAFYIPNNGTNHVYNNILNGEMFDGNNYKTDTHFYDKNNEFKYGTSNNILLSPDNFSSTWYVIGSVASDHHTLTPDYSSGYLAQQIVTLDSINPKYVSVLVKFNNTNHIALEPQLMLRDDQGNTTNLGYFERIVERMNDNQKYIGRIYDISKYDIPANTNVGKIVVRLRSLPGTNKSIYVDWVYCALSNELPILPDLD